MAKADEELQRAVTGYQRALGAAKEAAAKAAEDRERAATEQPAPAPGGEQR